VERARSTDGTISTPKSGHGRTVDMSASAHDVLQRHQAELKEQWLGEPKDSDQAMPSWAFPSLAWKPLDHATVERVFKRALKAAGLPAHHSPPASDTPTRPCSSWRA
jgi:site-specific recombinase XerD